jgi:hypothetical protein
MKTAKISEKGPKKSLFMLKESKKKTFGRFIKFQNKIKNS